MATQHNAYQIAAALNFQSVDGQRQADRVTRHHTMLLETKIKGNASGRPGPRAPTGDYRRSWTSRFAGGVGSVGTNKPQARRLEYGFTGADRLGRVYNQPPFPHVGPAVTFVRPSFFAAIGKIPTLGGG